MIRTIAAPERHLAAGRKSVIIKEVFPCVACGKYPAKGTAGMPVVFRATVFSYGQEQLFARVLVKEMHAARWSPVTLMLKGNDQWEAVFIPAQTGTLAFKIQAWIDAPGSWKAALEKKEAAGMDISVEMLKGLELGKHVSLLDKAAQREWHQLQELKRATGLRPCDIRPELYEKLVMNVPKTEISTSGTFYIGVERSRAGFSTWYELFPRSAAQEAGKHGTFQDVSRRLPELAAAGFDVIYLPPIHPIGRKHRKGRNNSLTAAPGDPGSPWAIGDETGGHKSVHKELGTLDDFQKLIGAARKRNMEIAMDMAFQCAPDHPYVTEHPEWFRWRPDGTVQFAENPPKKYEDILPFDFTSEAWPALWEELKSIFIFWIRQGIRIFRVDNPHTKPFQFWEWLIGDIKKEYPDALFLAEAFTRPHPMEHLAMVGFSQSYTYFTWRNTKEELQSYVTELTRGPKQYFFRPNFWPNTPDILPEHLVTGGENMHIIRLLLAATLSSNYGIYGPVYERGIRHPAAGKEEYADNEKYELKYWGMPQETRIWQIIKKVNAIRHRFTALQTTNNIAFLSITNDRLMAFLKRDEIHRQHLIIIINLDPEYPQSGWIDLPRQELDEVYGASWRVTDLLHEEAYHWTEDRHFVILDPASKPAHILSIQSQTHTKEVYGNGK